MTPWSFLTAADYLNAALNLLPRGLAWVRAQTQTMVQYFGAIADMLAMLHADAINLVDIELEPATTVNLIDLWEREYGLPDPCSPPDQTLARRQQAVVAKKTDPGGLSRTRYIALAAQFGVIATIDEHINPYTGAPDPTQHFTWRLNTNEATTIVTTTCIGRCTDRIRSWGDAELECAINARNRAGRIVLFSYL